MTANSYDGVRLQIPLLGIATLGKWMYQPERDNRVAPDGLHFGRTTDLAVAAAGESERQTHARRER